jgi:hypothetical protein
LRALVPAAVLLLAAGVFLLARARIQKPLPLWSGGLDRLAAAKTPSERYVALTDAAFEAFDKSDLELAEVLAFEALDDPRWEAHWNYGNVVHDCNAIIGRIRLRQGDVASARVFMKRASATPGSPQLRFSGPNLLFAKEMLAKREREAVIEYLTALERFWEAGRGRLGVWRKQITSGEEPDFGVNLYR